MRALRVLELAANGLDVICEDPESDERFSVRYDEKLRAVARGDLTPAGRVATEGPSGIAPREIQARIRSGATVEEIAAEAGTSVTRVERFAYPVLLERETMAQRARKARPTIDGITASGSVEETVAGTLAGRGYTGDLMWDAYKADDAWVLSLRWQVGRSENRAHWTFHPGRDNGTLTARDEAAAEVVDPALRVLRPLRELKSQPRKDVRERLAEQSVTDERAGARPPAQVDVARTGTESAVGSTGGPGTREPAAPRASGSASASASAPASVSVPTPAPAASPATKAAPSAPAKSSQPVQSQKAVPTPRPGPRRGNRPAMPSWEDVLLGTRKG